MQVTRHLIPENRKNQPEAANVECWRPAPVTKFQSVGFVDWLSIYQRHDLELPKLMDGAFLSINSDGELVNQTFKKLRIRGSFDTSVLIRCDGHTVSFDGNVSRFRRSDNVFGLTFSQCLAAVNDLLAEFDLPPFTEGSRFFTSSKGDVKSHWTGASVTRVDVTENFATGSKENAYHYMRWLSGQQSSRLKTGTRGDGETVDFGRGSRRVYTKAYLKGPELRRHGKDNDYLLQLADWCDSVGLVRFEVTYKSTQLIDMACKFLGAFDMAYLEADFNSRKDILFRGSADCEELSDLPKSVLGTYRMWQAGDDISSKLKKSQFYLHRKMLLSYGVDIAIKSNVTPLKTKTRVIKLGPVSPPEWYELPTLKRGT